MLCDFSIGKTRYVCDVREIEAVTFTYGYQKPSDRDETGTLNVSFKSGSYWNIKIGTHDLAHGREIWQDLLNRWKRAMGVDEEE